MTFKSRLCDSRFAALIFGACVVGLALGGAVGDADTKAANTQADPVVLSVDTDHILRDGADEFVGVDLNYLRDSDANRPAARPLTSALLDMGAKWLRYPGGGKSDFHTWSKPPYDKPLPTPLGWYATVPGARMDFDQYIACARTVGAQPYVVVGYNTLQQSGLSEQQWLENAVSWVTYANRTKNYGVKYWEIGNENWNNNKAAPEEMARVVARFSQAMKAVDPSIHIGASGNNDAWWSKFLPVAAPHLDFVSISHYNTWDWKSYDFLVQHPETDLTVNGTSTLAATLVAIDRYTTPADSARLKVIVAETNSKDYTENGWPGGNTLGHAHVTFETLGALMKQPRIQSAMVWTTRWVNDEEAPHSQFYALGAQNQILPTGRAVALWSFARANMITVDGVTGLVSAYASCSADRSSLSVWIVNRGTRAVTGVKLGLKSPVPYRKVVCQQFSGTGPDDENPIWKQVTPTSQVDSNVLRNIQLPGVSVTVLSLSR